MNETNRLKLPFLIAGQAQKEFFHNEALQILDTVVQPVVEALPADQPPAAPVHGKAYLVSGSPLGLWEEQAHALASFTEGGWRFVRPFNGMEVKLRATGETLTFAEGAWLVGVVNARSIRVAGRQVLGPQEGAIASPVGGGVVDLETRNAVTQILVALRAHGLIASD